MKQKVEFIESYIKVGNDYQWNDNHGELIRCKDCIFFDGHYCHNNNWGDGFGDYTSPAKAEDGFCDWADRRGEHEKAD